MQESKEKTPHQFMERGSHFYVGVYKPNSVSRREVGTIAIYLGLTLLAGSSDSPSSTFCKVGLGTILHTRKDFAPTPLRGRRARLYVGPGSPPLQVFQTMLYFPCEREVKLTLLS